jgi:hypothetical protein
MMISKTKRISNFGMIFGKTAIFICFIVLAPVLIAAEDVMDITTLRHQVVSNLNHPCLIVTGTVATLVDGKPLSTTAFEGRFKKPALWSIRWWDIGEKSFKTSGVVWGDAVDSHLWFSGSKAVESGADVQMTIAAATGISHGIAPWFYGLFHGDLDELLPLNAVLSRRADLLLADVPERLGYTAQIRVLNGLVIGAETVTDTSQRPDIEEPVFDDAQAKKIIERQGEVATPDKIAHLRDVIAQANASMKNSRSIFKATYIFNWKLDQSLKDADLIPVPESLNETKLPPREPPPRESQF